jgi:hypothetical protein
MSNDVDASPLDRVVMQKNWRNNDGKVSFPDGGS